MGGWGVLASDLATNGESESAASLMELSSHTHGWAAAMLADSDNSFRRMADAILAGRRRRIKRQAGSGAARRQIGAMIPRRASSLGGWGVSVLLLLSSDARRSSYAAHASFKD